MPLDSVFSLKQEYISFKKAENVIKKKLGYLFPNKTLKELIKSLPQTVFINGQKQNINPSLIPIISSLIAFKSSTQSTHSTHSTLSSLLEITPETLNLPITPSHLHSCLSSLFPSISSVSPSLLLSIFTSHPTITFPQLLSFFHSSIYIKCPLQSSLCSLVD